MFKIAKLVAVVCFIISLLIITITAFEIVGLPTVIELVTKWSILSIFDKILISILSCIHILIWIFISILVIKHEYGDKNN